MERGLSALLLTVQPGKKLTSKNIAWTVSHPGPLGAVQLGLTGVLVIMALMQAMLLPEWFRTQQISPIVSRAHFNLTPEALGVNFLCRTELLRLARDGDTVVVHSMDRLAGNPGISGFGEQLELPNGVGERGELLITQFDGGATYVVFKVGDA